MAPHQPVGGRGEGGPDQAGHFGTHSAHAKPERSAIARAERLALYSTDMAGDSTTSLEGFGSGRLVSVDAGQAACPAARERPWITLVHRPQARNGHAARPLDAAPTLVLTGVGSPGRGRE
jgi:hypothetical protein